jgi:Transposase IS4
MTSVTSVKEDMWPLRASSDHEPDQYPINRCGQYLPPQLKKGTFLLQWALSAHKCLSTLHGCESIDSFRRWSASEKKHIQVTRLAVNKAYNQHMGGVDLIDMLISYYRINVRSNKYYMRIIFHPVDLAIANGWLLYRRHCFQLRRQKKEILSLLEFCVEIAAALRRSDAPQRLTRRGRPPVKLSSNENRRSRIPRAAPKRIPADSVQQDGFNHWSTQTNKGRCRYPGCQGFSTITCTKCRIRLCLNARNNFFRSFHQ